MSDPRVRFKVSREGKCFFFFYFTEDFELLKSTKDFGSWTCSVHAVLPVTGCGGVRVFHGACLVEVARVAPCCLASSPGFKAPGGSWFLLPSVTPGDPEFFFPSLGAWLRLDAAFIIFSQSCQCQGEAPLSVLGL